MRAMVCWKARCTVRLKDVKDMEAVLAWYRLHAWRRVLENAARVWAEH